MSARQFFPVHFGLALRALLVALGWGVPVAGQEATRQVVPPNRALPPPMVVDFGPLEADAAASSVPAAPNSPEPAAPAPTATPAPAAEPAFDPASRVPAFDPANATGRSAASEDVDAADDEETYPEDRPSPSPPRRASPREVLNTILAYGFAAAVLVLLVVIGRHMRRLYIENAFGEPRRFPLRPAKMRLGANLSGGHCAHAKFPPPQAPDRTRRPDVAF